MSRVDVEVGPDIGLAWHFGDPFAEQRAIEAGRAVVWLPNREVFTITGEERISWLNQLTTAVFESGQSTQALILDGNGHVLHGFAGIDDGQTFWAWAEPGAAAPLIEWLLKMRFWTKADVELRPDLRLAWVGAEIACEGIEIPSEFGNGRFLIASESKLPEQNAGVWALDAARIAAGIPKIGFDTDDKAIPNEIGLYATVLGKGCYPGQETVARIQNLGRPPRRLVRLLIDGSEERLPAPGSAIELEGKQIGTLGSVAQHHELGPIGLALIKRNAPVAATLLVDGLSAAQEVLVDPEIGEHFRPNFASR